MWNTVSDSPHDHEREALAFLKKHLPSRAPYHVWTNFEFTTSNGQLYEVDALAITDNGIHLIEIKSHSGKIVGDAGTWQWTTPKGKFRQFNNPRILANRKAKTLKSLIESSKAFRKDRRSVPYLSECVFLSSDKLDCGLNVQGRHNIFGLGGDPGKPGSGPASLPGIIEHLTSLNPDASGRPRRRIQRDVVDKLVRAMDQIGIREQSSRREVGDYQISELLEDVEADTTIGVAYQDFLGKHRSRKLERRLRIYPLELNASTELRQTAHRAAGREFDLLQPLDHVGIIQPLDYTEHERGPVLFFDYHPEEVSLAAFLQSPENRSMTVETRLSVIRQLVEAIAYANGKGVFHRSLCPSAVLVRADEGGDPLVRVTNWHAGARLAAGSNPVSTSGTVYSHVEALGTSDADLYRAPEFGQPNARSVSLDVFSLGALALFVLTGQQPAGSARQLRSTLAKVGHLDPSVVADGIDSALADIVIEATEVNPGQRLDSAEDILLLLDLLEEQWSLDEADAADVVDPLEAHRGDLLADGRLKVSHRLGKGSSAIALLVQDTENNNKFCVAKVAHDEKHNDRLLDEASALAGLQHSSIVSLLDDDPLDLSGRTAILITYAGPKIDLSRAEPKPARTLASRISDGPIGVELAQRWGEDLLGALRYLEEMGRAHRDIKPENLGVAPRGENDELHLMLFDFSLSAAPVDSIEAGTPGYRDPFLELRGRWDPAGDRYSAAVTLFEITTGSRPRFGDGDVDPVMVKTPPTVELEMFDVAAAPGMVSFFTKSLQPDAADRFGSAKEMFFAWHEAFSPADTPATPSDNPDEELVLPAGTTTDTALALLPLTRRALSALANGDILTVSDLLALPVMKLRSMPGVGKKTRLEIREVLDLLEATFGRHEASTGFASGERSSTSIVDASTHAGDDSDEAHTSTGGEELTGYLVDVVSKAVPAARSDQQSRDSLVRILVGIDERGRDPWASQSDLADWISITSSRVSQLTTALRKRWLKDPEVTKIRQQIRLDLESFRVASVDQVAARLLILYPVTGLRSSAFLLARGLVRLATLAEERQPKPGWISRRRNQTVLLASEVGEGAEAQGLADYAVLVGKKTSKLIRKHDVLGRRELLGHLHQVPLPAGVSPLPDAHLADLAADLCDDAAVNPRLELYRTGLDPVGAFRAARRAFVTGGSFDVGMIQEKISARFPEAAQVPDRPGLDEILSSAGVELVWDAEVSTYRSPRHEVAATSVVSQSTNRYGTNTDAPAPLHEVDSALDFEQRMSRSRSNGRLLVLVSEPSGLRDAEHQLNHGGDGLTDVTVDVDQWLVAQIERLTESGKPTWETLTKADSAGRSGPSWGNLGRLVDRGLQEFTQQLLDLEGTVLLTNLGLLARYDRLDVVSVWRDALHSGRCGVKALWLLVPSTATSDVPLLDGRAIPVISRNEWRVIPDDWLRNAHRSSGNQPSSGVS